MSRFAGWKPALAFFVLLALTTRTKTGSWNDMARMATIDSLVARHTFAIDDSRFVVTSDKILIDGHFYSNKQPIMEVAGAAIFLPLHEVFNVPLYHDSPSAGYYLLTLFLVGVPSALAVALLDRWFRRRGFSPIDRAVAVGGFAVATLVWPYSTVFNNHTVAGALLLVAVLMLAPGRRTVALAASTSRAALVAGLALGLSATFDLPAAVFFGPVLLTYLLVQRERAAALWFVAGVIPALAIQVGLQLVISGDFLPANLHREYWDFPGSPWVGVPISAHFHLASLGEAVSYAFHSLVGSRGVLSYSPFLLWGLAGLLAATRSTARAERNFAIAMLVALVLTAGYLILFATEYGGMSYGDRYFVGLTGVIACFTAAGCWTEAPRWRRAALALALAVSVVIAAIGTAVNPWKAETPVVATSKLQRAGIRYTARHLGVLDLYVPARWRK